MNTELVVARSDFERLRGFLYPGDHDEHAAVLAVGWMRSGVKTRLLVREVVPVPPEAWLPGERSYRFVPPRFVAETANALARVGLGYVMVHSHPGSGAFTRLSDDDFSSQQRGYRAIADIVAPAPVAGIALGEASFDGLAWSADGHVEPIARMTVVGLPMQTFDRVPQVGHGVEDPTHDRARRVFGSAGIARLHSLRIAIIGAGGGGMQLAQLCAKLGVGSIVGVDWDPIQLPNVPRLVGSSIADALEARPKLALMAELVAAAGRGTAFEPLVGDVYDQAVAWRLRDVDCLFLAVDTMRARSVFNALCHTYLIPGFQIGARVEAPRGEVDLVYAVERVVFPDHGCLACGRWINPRLLHRELLTPDERRAEAYGIPDDATDPIDPNVITLDAVGAALAANDFLFAFTGLHREGVHTEHRQEHLDRRESLREKAQRDAACLWCGRSARSAYAVGDARDVLPCRTTPNGHNASDGKEQERKGEGR